MSEVKRGAPADNGDYACLVRTCSGNEYNAILRRSGDSFCAQTGAVFTADQILAYRKHEPIKLPELRKLPVPRQAVIKSNLYGIHLATISPAGQAVITYTESGRGYDCDVHGYRELTKAECEAAGFAWPF